MRVIVEYCCLVEGTESLHVIRPGQANGNSTQYVLIFEGQRDWSLLALVGDWEHEAVLFCLSKIADQLVDSTSPRTGSFAVGSYAAHSRSEASGHPVGAKISYVKAAPDSKDNYGRFTVQLQDDAQTPIQHGSQWSGMDKRTFHIKRSDEQLMSIGRLLQRLEDASFESVFESDRGDWFMPNWLTPISSRYGSALGMLAAREQVQICQRHVREVCPDGFVKFWLSTFEVLQVPEAALCPDCNGFFPRYPGESWRKRCLGCYRGNPPTTHSQADIEKATSLFPLWLRRVSPTIGEATQWDEG